MSSRGILADSLHTVIPLLPEVVNELDVTLRSIAVQRLDP